MLLRSRLYALAGHNVQQRRNTLGEAVNRRSEKNVQQRRPPPAAETGRSCWGRGQQDASGSEADAGSRNPGSVCEAGKPVSKEHLHSDKHWLLIESSYRCVFVLSQHPCPLRRSRASSPKGRALEVRESVISITKKSPRHDAERAGGFCNKEASGALR